MCSAPKILKYLKTECSKITMSVQLASALCNTKTLLPTLVGLERKHFAQFEKHRYYTAPLQVDSLTGLCFVTCENSNRCFTIAHGAVDSLYTSAVASKACFQGSLAYGTLVDNVFTLYDCIAICGTDISSRDFETRQRACSTLIHAVRDIPITLQLAQYTPLRDSVQHQLTGLHILLSANLQNVFTLHPANVVRFTLKSGKVYLANGDELAAVKVKIDDAPDDPAVVECSYVADKRWKVTVRLHDALPSTKFEYKKTLIRIQENLSIQSIDCKALL